MAGGRGEDGVIGGLPGEFAGGGVADRHDGHAGLLSCPVDAAPDHIDGVGSAGFDEDDAGLGRQGVRRLDVEGFLGFPVGRSGSGRVNARKGGAAVFIDFAEAGRVGDLKESVETLQVAGDVGVVVGIDDGDGLAAAVAYDSAEADGVNAVGVTDLVGAESVGRGKARKETAIFERLKSELSRASGGSFAGLGAAGRRKVGEPLGNPFHDGFLHG